MTAETLRNEPQSAVWLRKTAVGGFPVFSLFQSLIVIAVAAVLPPLASATTFNVAAFGAKANGATDDTVAFQKALDDAGKAGGGVVDVPAGRYVIKGNLAVPAGVTLQGTFRVPPTLQRNKARELTGAVLMAYAGRGSEQTFEQEGPHVQDAEPVKSALLVGNQASGGFEAGNRAGKRTQLAANESASAGWTAEAKKHYCIAVGAEGDGRYLRGWHGRERTMRWSFAESLLRLPVVPGESYTLTLKLHVPKAALSPEAGLYLENKRLASLKAGVTTLTAELPLSRAGQLTLRVVCAGWIPTEHNPASNDDRTLGVQLFGITMRAKIAGKRVFQANTGEWKWHATKRSCNQPPV